MNRLLMVISLVTLAALAGCQNGNMDLSRLESGIGLNPAQGSNRNLGDTGFPQAFAAAKEVFKQYYSIQSAEPATGKIIGRPKNVDVGNDRLLGNDPARQVATMKITSKGDQVVAHCVVQQQRMGTGIYKNMGYSQERENYSGNPGDETPGMVGAATTAKQNEAWRDEKVRHDIEVKMLNDLYARLHGD